MEGKADNQLALLAITDAISMGLVVDMMVIRVLQVEAMAACQTIHMEQVWKTHHQSQEEGVDVTNACNNIIRSGFV